VAAPGKSCGCADFSRSQLFRRAAAEAGRGLPAVEPGMPVPAGTGLSRRSFISRAAGLAIAVYGASTLGWDAFEEGIAAAAGAPAEPVLVSVFLAGGVDSLSLLAPTGHSRYAQLRPTLALSPEQGSAFSEDTSLRWHPSASALATLHGEGKVTVFPAIGYADPNQSHFTSRHYWEVGEVNPFGRFGWLGRYLDRHGATDNPLQGLALGWDLAPSLAAQDVPVATVSRPDQYDFWAPGVWSPIESPMLSAFGDLGSPATTDAGLRTAREATAATARLRGQLEPFQAGYSTPAGVTYPPGSEFADRLASLAAMLAAGLPLRVVAIEAQGSYDTHSDQAQNLPGDLKVTCDSLLAFQRDLEARGLQDRVLVHAWSEFGRRPEENGSGTDHGAGGASFVVGSQTRGTMVGGFPGLVQLDDRDNLRSTSDYRGLYCALLEQWLGADPAAIIPNASSFQPPAILKP
jgi:uncharacterized protein (DUF1501 family)